MASHGTGSSRPIAARACSAMLSVRSIATGWIEPRPSWNGMSSDLITSSVATITATTDPISRPCTCGRSRAVGEEEHEDEDHDRDEEEDDPEGRGNHAFGTVDPVVARGLPRRGLLEPLVVRGLLRSRLGIDRLERPEEQDAPGVDRVARGPRLHAGPFLLDHRPRVADELAGELGRRLLGKQLRRLELLCHDDRLGLGAAARHVVVREREEDDEAEEDGEAGGEHAEDARGPVAVVEVATRRRPTPHEQHQRDGHRRRTDHEHDCPEEAHPTSLRSQPREGRGKRCRGSPG